ncbi:outer membrane protein [Devosia ginsengisoli]|uniref:Porin family protein n=1 Tax=Devosia ginsengisoli TaxID=400770 RepID=A0A5B8LVR5_9HYPH|nr:outer membrane beta-barrel protein [Devosia ginsengisoli]QDZ11480.1 porin family protein [Devosia ginsengisoli]
MNKFILAAAAMTALSAPAVAADLIIDDPVYYTDAGFDWSGFYAGLAAGYGSGTARSVGDVTGTTTDTPLNGGLVGVTLGGNVQYDSFVLGIEGDVLWSGMGGTTACTAVPAYDCNASVDWLGSLRGRAGVAMDNVLLFVTGGLAAAGGTGTITPTFPGTTSTFSDTFVGWTAGAGVEVAVTDSMTVKAEYSYSNLGSRTAPLGTLGTIQTFTVSPAVHAVKVGLNFHF